MNSERPSQQVYQFVAESNNIAAFKSSVDLIFVNPYWQTTYTVALVSVPPTALLILHESPNMILWKHSILVANDKHSHALPVEICNQDAGLLITRYLQILYGKYAGMAAANRPRLPWRRRNPHIIYEFTTEYEKFHVLAAGKYLYLIGQFIYEYLGHDLNNNLHQTAGITICRYRLPKRRQKLLQDIAAGDANITQVINVDWKGLGGIPCSVALEAVSGHHSMIGVKLTPGYEYYAVLREIYRSESERLLAAKSYLTAKEHPTGIKK